MPIVSLADVEKLRRPHVARCFLGEFYFPTGLKRWHTGYGNVTIGGYVWTGVADLLGGRLVSVGQVEEPRFGQAAALTLIMSGADVAFFRSVKETARDIEGRDATIYWAAFDQETEELITALIPVFRRGKMSAPTLHRDGIGQRSITLTIEGIWASMNFAPGGKWNSANQHAKFPGDLGLDWVGQSINETWQNVE